MGFLFPASGGIKEGQSVFFAPAVSQVTLTQDNQYATLAYFGTTCLELQQNTLRSRVIGKVEKVPVEAPV